MGVAEKRIVEVEGSEMELRKLHTIKDFLNSKKGKEISTLLLKPPPKK